MHAFDFRDPVSATSHLLGFLMALPGSLILWRRSRGEPVADRLSLLIFGLCLALCYATSALYHGLRLPPGRLAVLDRLDHIGIFLLIAGTYTPLAWRLLSGWWRRAVLGSVWLVAAVASMLLAGGLPLPNPLGTGLYLAMGWGSVACYAELSRAVSRRALRPLLAGGLLYSVGAAANLLGWPVLFPGVFGAHEVFHLFVLAGSWAHYRLILRVVVPFERVRCVVRPASRDAAGVAGDLGGMSVR